ncbi:MAG: alkaline phosphatase [Myxococcota bacterium]|jgi:alkaline phosphatase
MRTLFLLLIAGCGTSDPKPGSDTGTPSTTPTGTATGSTPTATPTGSTGGGTTPTGTTGSGTTPTGATSTGSTPTGTTSGPTGDTAPPAPTPRAVILLIGDGMGPGQLEAGGFFRTGAADGLTVWSLPHQAMINPSGASGITDSAAAGTAMATGAVTFNGRIGMDRSEAPVQSLVELAASLDYATGVVTTTSLQHATPASFTAHFPDRNDQVAIADLQVAESPVDVMLGGGRLYINPEGVDSRRDDDGLLTEIADRGFHYVTTAADLEAAPDDGKLWGAFAGEHLPYVEARGVDVPSLPAMVSKALELLEDDPEGFFLVIEAGRIDHAGHGNLIERTVSEVAEMDETVEVLQAWMDGHPDASLIVTADHETGGLDVLSGGAAGEIPEVEWLWGSHSSRHIRAFGMGPGTEPLDGLHGSHMDVHAMLRSRLTGEPFVRPEAVMLPNGDLSDLPAEAVRQVNPTSYGEGFNQLDALQVGVDAWGLVVGIEGLFELESNTVVLLLDIDREPGSGPAQLHGALSDNIGPLDSVLSNLKFLAPPTVPSFGADFAMGSLGGAEVVNYSQFAGLRGLDPPDNLPWLFGAVVFGPGVRADGAPLPPAPPWGLEFAVPWALVFPELEGSVPPGAEVAIAAVLVNGTGTHTSNQALPPFPPGLSESPGATPVPLPGVLVVPIDSDGDGIGDGGGVPWVE